MVGDWLALGRIAGGLVLLLEKEASVAIIRKVVGDHPFPLC